jgi:hypothetical protein
MEILESFEGWIEEITPEIIYATIISLIDEERFYVEFTHDQFKVSVEPVLGMIFTMNVYENKLEFVIPPPWTQEELDAIYKESKEMAEKLSKLFI